MRDSVSISSVIEQKHPDFGTCGTVSDDSDVESREERDVLKRIAEGVTLLGRFRPCDCGSFVLHHGSEAFLLEMPPCRNKTTNPWTEARRFVERHELTVKGLLVTHAHGDHMGGYYGFRQTFPDVPLFLHRSFRNIWRLGRLEWTFDGPVKEFSVGGEPLHVVHAPKHSHHDQLVIFRGTVCTGDWSLGRAPDCNSLVAVHEKLHTLRFVRDYLRERRYQVHTAYSAHANEFRSPIDFAAMLDDMGEYWTRRAAYERRATGRLRRSA